MKCVLTDPMDPSGSGLRCLMTAGGLLVFMMCFHLRASVRGPSLSPSVHACSMLGEVGECVTCCPLTPGGQVIIIKPFTTDCAQSLIKDFLLGAQRAEGRDLWPRLVTVFSNRVSPHPVAAGLRAKSGPTQTQKCKNHDELASGTSVIKTSIVSLRGGRSVLGRSMTWVVTSQSSQMARELSLDCDVERRHRWNEDAEIDGQRREDDLFSARARRCFELYCVFILPNRHVHQFPLWSQSLKPLRPVTFSTFNVEV